MHSDSTSSLVQGIALGDIDFFIIIGIMLLSGVIGGFANYFLSGRDDKSQMKLLGFCTLGIVASLIVPLFLKMISSDLLEIVKTRPTNFFVFAGFCLLSAVFSRRFLENVYNKLLQQVGELKENVNKIEEASIEPESTGQMDRTQDLTQDDISNEDLRVLRALYTGRFFFRSVSGMASDTQLPKPIVKERLLDLIQKGFVMAKIGKDGSPRWSLSAKGRDTLAIRPTVADTTPNDLIQGHER